MWANARDMLARAAGKPIRVASKSVRCRELIGAILDRDPGFRGLMTFTLRESLFLSEHGFSNLLLAYPTTDREAIRALSVLEAERPAALHALQRASAREIAERRTQIAEAVGRIAPLDFVNGGGTGSLAATAAEPAVTEVTAGSGFYAPTLFDHYSSFSLRSAAMFALPVVRRPSGSIATALGRGYLASGPADKMRLPEPYLPHGLRLDPIEGAGEVQTPLLGPAAGTLEPGDRVYLRHA